MDFVDVRFSSLGTKNPCCNDARQMDLDDGELAPTEFAKEIWGFAALSRFAIANGMTSEVHQAFQSRQHLVDSVPGFVRMDVLSPSDSPDEVWLMTYWRDEPSFRAWHRSHLYHESHKGIPKGLKLVPGRTNMRFFKHVSS